MSQDDGQEFSEKQKEIMNFLEFHQAIEDKSPEILRDMEDYIDGLSHQETAFLLRHQAWLDWRDRNAAAANMDVE